MVARRTVLVGALAAFTAGCVDLEGSDAAESDDTNSDGAETPTDAPENASEGTDPSETVPGYFFTAAPVEANDGLEPVLSTDDEAVAAIEPLVDVIVEVTEVFEVTHRSITSEEAEAFEELTADVERYFTGNPPGYYFGHEGRRVSVTLGGG